MNKHVLSRCASIFLIVFLTLALIPASLFLSVSAADWDGVSVASSFGGGNGTEADPYLITNAGELAFLAATVNAKNACKDTYFKLTSDISLGGKPWTPIGTNTTKAEIFSGNFDGDGHKITNFYCSTTNIYAGLFGYTLGATIKNLTVDGIECSGALNVGVFVGYAESGTKIINCVSSVNSVQGEQAGGIAGRIGLVPGNLILGCVNYSTVYAKGTTTYAFAAGIASAAGGTTVAYCANYGNIIGEAPSSYVSAGGIVGMHGADKLEATITYCFNSGDVSATAGVTTYVAAGGIVGRANQVQFGEITHCASIGTYTANEAGHSGAIFGYNYNIGIIEDCYTDSNTVFGYDKVASFQGGEVTILAANDIKGDAALTNMKLDPALFISVPNGLPELNASSIVINYFAPPAVETTTPETTAPVPETTAAQTTKSDESVITTAVSPVTYDVETSRKPETTATSSGDNGGCGSSLIPSMMIITCIICIVSLISVRILRKSNTE